MGYDDMYQNGEYLRKNPTWDVEDSPWKAAQILKMLLEHNIRPCSIGEVGCGAGEILINLQRVVWESVFYGEITLPIGGNSTSSMALFKTTVRKYAL